MADIDLIAAHGQGRVDFTVGSALDIFGGSLPYESVVKRQ
jgi:phosphoribosylformimino-5-aminoimidazole carboxamide ribotide isomerase